MATGLSPEHKTTFSSADRHVDTLLAQYGSTPPTQGGTPSSGGRGGGGPTAAGSELATSWAAIPTHINGGSPDPVDTDGTHTHYAMMSCV